MLYKSGSAEEECLFSVPGETLSFMLTPGPEALDLRSTAILQGLTEPFSQQYVLLRCGV